MRLENVREYKFDPKKVIEGLNGYYESDKCNGYITVYRYFGGPAYLGADVWLSALIEWLRVDHDIFYYPGMDIRDSVEPGLILDQIEAARSAEKTCGLRAHIKGELSKRGLWFDKNADIPELVDTIFRAYDCCEERASENRKELNALEDTVSKVRSRLNSKFIPLPGYEDDLEKLADIALRAVEARDETINRLTRTWDQELKNSQKTDINKLIRDCCLRYNIVAPSRYLSDEASVEYVFSLLDNQRGVANEYIRRANKAEEEVKKLKEQKDRSFAILQDLYRDIFKKQPDGLSAEDIATKILDKVLEIASLLHKSVDDYKLSLKDYILHDIKKYGYRYDGLQSKSVEEIVDWIIQMAISDHSFVVLKDIYSTVAAPVERLRYNDCDGPTVDHMKDYILKRFEDLQFNTEYCIKKMAELDGCQKDLI